MNGYPGKGKIKGGRFSCCLWTTWNEPYGPLAHLFEKPADKGCAFTRGPCRSLKIARTCPKGVVLLFHEQPRVFQCGKVNSCFYENTQLRLNPCQLELRRFVVLFHLLFFQIHLPLSQHVPWKSSRRFLDGNIFFKRPRIVSRQRFDSISTISRENLRTPIEFCTSDLPKKVESRFVTVLFM